MSPLYRSLQIFYLLLASIIIPVFYLIGVLNFLIKFFFLISFIRFPFLSYYTIDFNFEIPDLIKSLLICNTHEESKNFRENIRQFNSALSFASFGASVFAGSDRPDLVARVFQAKLSALLELLTVKHILGQVIGFTYVVEWQKRGLPHAHILLIFHNNSKIRTPEEIDSVVCAEIPDEKTEKKLFDTIKSCMIHGPCG